MKRNGRAWFVAILLLLLLALNFRETPVEAQQGLGGPIARDMWVPSAFRFFFGDVTSSDIYLQKNGANVLGVSGAIGGLGATANTTTSPAGPFNWGQVTLASNTATVVFAKPYTNAPVCFATDQTTPQLVKAPATATQVVITDTVGATDVVSWICMGNPN